MSSPAHSIFAFYADVSLSPLGTSIDKNLELTNVNTTNFADGGIKSRQTTLYGDDTTITTHIDEVATKDHLDILTLAPDKFLTTMFRQPIPGDVTRSTRSVLTSASPINGAVGDVWQSDLVFVNEKAPLLIGRGTNTGGVLRFATDTVTGVGDAVQFGTLSATDTLFGVLHVDFVTIAGTSPTLDILVERDAANTFLAPTTVLTFDQVTDVAGTFQFKTTTPSAETEEWYRVTFTIAGAAASFRWFLSLYIDP